MVDNPDTVALETVAVIAERAGVQPSAMVRFAQALGFDGFSDMQRPFRERLIERSPTYAERLRREPPGPQGSDAPGILTSVVTAGRSALDRLADGLDRERLERAVGLLAMAPMVHLVAQRRSFPVVVYLAYGLGQLGRRAQLMDGMGGMLQHQAKALGPGDALLAVSFRPYAEETMAVARLARPAGASLVAITDAPLSPLARIADTALLVEESEIRGVRTLTASMGLATTLILAVGQRLLRDETQ